MRHQSPSTSATHYVQNRIEDIAIGPGPWSSTSTLPLRQQWRNQRPLCIIQVGRVGLSGHADKSTRPFSKHSLKDLSRSMGSHEKFKRFIGPVTVEKSKRTCGRGC